MNSLNPHIDNIILNFGVTDASINSIETRLKKKNQNSIALKITKDKIKNEISANEAAIFKKMDANTRIYINAHGGLSRNRKIIGHENPEALLNEIEYSDVEVSNYLEKILNKDQFSKISIIACHTGLRNEEKEYFAAHLHRELASRGIHTNVLARNSLTNLIGNAGENTGKKVVRKPEERVIDQITNFQEENMPEWLKSHSNKPGTKSLFTFTSDGKQLIVDAYIAKFAELTIQSCKDIISTLSKDENEIQISKLNSIINKCQDLEKLEVEAVKKLNYLVKDIAAELSLKNNEIQKRIEKASLIVQTSIGSISMAEKINEFNDNLDSFCDMLYFIINNDTKNAKANRKMKLEIKQTISDFRNSEMKYENIKQLISKFNKILNNSGYKQSINPQFIKLCTSGKKAISNWNSLPPAVVPLKA